MSDRRRGKKGAQVAPPKPTLTRDQRHAIEDEVERLIAILDAIEPDPDLEDNGDLEPSLGAYFGQHVDAELDESDREPSLGTPDRMINQTHLYSNAQYVTGVDLELDRSDYEDGGDREPNGDELDGPDDNGIGDEDGLLWAEQTGYYEEARRHEEARS